jgi:hypothetical protein
VRVLESDAAHVLLEVVPGESKTEEVPGPARTYVRVTMPGMGLVDELGRPEVPVGSVRVGVPPGAVPRLRVVSQEWSDSRPGAIAPVPERYGERQPFGVDQVVEGPREEGPAYRAAVSYPAEPFQLSKVANLRGLDVVSVIWHGVVAEVFARSHRVLERAVLEVRFEEDRARARPVPRRPAPSDRLWDRTVARSVVNGERARVWARGGPGDATSVGDSPWGAGTQWKVEITDTGAAELTFDALAGAGFPSGISVDEVDVYQRSFDLDRVDDPLVPAESLFVPIAVPVWVRDRDGDGFFSSGDGLVLYGLSFRDRWMTSPYEHEDKYDDRNFVWVRIAPGGERMPLARAGGSLSGAAADSLLSTPWTVHREDDRRYYLHPPDQKAGWESIEAEIYYWNDATTSTSLDNTFPAFHPCSSSNPCTRGWTLGEPTSDPTRGDPFEVRDPRPGTAASLRVRVIGGGGGGSAFGGTVHRPYTCVLWFYVNGDSLATRSFYNNGLFTGDIVPPDRTVGDYAVPADLLHDGTNTFNLRGFSFRGVGTSQDAFETRFFFDWYEVTYERRLLARDDRFTLRTTSGPGGNVLARIEGFGGSDVRLFDVTDPLRPARVDLVDSTQIVASGGGFDLRFDHDNAVRTGVYHAIRESAIPAVPASRITAVGGSAALAGGVGARYVVVSHPSFLAGAQELASFRTSRYTTHVANVHDLYDLFDNGTAHPEAIKAFATYAYHRWSDPIAFLCLVGDGSEDHRGLTANADPDFVPSQSLYANYEGSAEESDQYFAEVTRPAPGMLWDDLSDIYVGRLSVGTPEELAWNLARIRAYEAGSGDEAWRRRVLLLADDQFSGSLGAGVGEGYGWRGERGFEDVSESIAASLAAHPFDKILTEKIYSSTWSHPCPDSCYSGSNPPNCEAGGRDCGFWYDCRNDAVWFEEYNCMKTDVRAATNPEIRRIVEDGVLMWNFQGHANKYWLQHEEVFYDWEVTRLEDVQHLENFGKPFLFLGFACHLAEFDRDDERAQGDCVSEKMMQQIPPGTTDAPGGAVGVFASSGFEFLAPNLTFNEVLMQAFFFPDRADVIGAGGDLPNGPTVDGVYRWTLGESTLRARLLFQERYPFASSTRQSAQRFVLLGDPGLEPNLGGPSFTVTVNGETVHDGEYLGLGGVASTMRVEARAENGRGVVAMRVYECDCRDPDCNECDRREIPPSEFEVTVVDTSEHGVAQSRLLTYEAPVRAEDYDVVVEAEDGQGVVSEFRMFLRNAVAIVEALAYPNPFANETSLYFILTTAAPETKVTVYTLNGRRIWETTVAGEAAENQVTWDGRDSDGTVVANGSYLVRVRASGANAVETTFPVVKMR